MNPCYEVDSTDYLVFYFESPYVNEQPIVKEKQNHVDKSPLNPVNKVQLKTFA
jgi:hypothetical protein